MNEKAVFAPIEDVVGATELINENEKMSPLFERIFGMENTISLVNFGCIRENDKVLVIANESISILAPLSYIGLPGQLLSINTYMREKQNQYALREEKKWNALQELLSGYLHTKPDFQRIDIDNMEYDEAFNVCIAETAHHRPNVTPGWKGRFTLETGDEYERFEKLLIKTEHLLTNQGRLIILSKPGWILKCWELIEKLGLQLEYESYSLYTEDEKHPNAYVWLRFVKREKDFNMEYQKRNLLSLMKDNYIDRLFAHRNNLVFPYVELSYSNAQGYVQVEQQLQHLQYFFSLETTKNLAQLCEGYTACLTTPSIAQYAYETNKDVVLFEQDNRFRQNRGLKFVKYDLNTGLTKLTKNKYAGKFDRVICDPPFDIKLDNLARDIDELLKPNKDSIAYVVFPASRRSTLINAMALKGWEVNQDDNDIVIEYTKPPKLVRVEGKEAIRLFKFTYNAQK